MLVTQNMKRNRNWTQWISALALAAILAPATAVPARAEDPMDVVRQLNHAFIQVADQVSASVVVIDVVKPMGTAEMGGGEENPFWEFLPPQFRRQFEREGDSRRVPRVSGQGSGVVVREDGYIVTNSHVVEGAERIKVRFQNGKVYDGEVRGVDGQSDLAVIKIEAEKLPVAEFADSRKVRVGEFAIAIGAPFDLDYSVTFGHVSAKGRSGIIRDPAMDQDFIQTDANINPGNSGGPLVNIDGEIIGINTMIRGMNTGIGFAIPSNLAKEVAWQLIENGRFTRAWLGVEIRALRDFPDFQSKARGVEEGVVVVGIVNSGPAAKSDLKLGDVVTAVADRPVGTAQELKNEIRSKPIGKPVELQVVREKKEVTVKVTPEAWPEDATVYATRTRPESGSETSADLGLTARPLTEELARRYDLESSDGMVVTSVEAGSPAERAGVRPGDLITDVNGASVNTLREYRAALREADLKQGVMINLLREGVHRFVLVKESGE